MGSTKRGLPQLGCGGWGLLTALGCMLGLLIFSFATRDSMWDGYFSGIEVAAKKFRSERGRWPSTPDDIAAFGPGWEALKRHETSGALRWSFETIGPSDCIVYYRGRSFLNLPFSRTDRIHYP